MRRQTDEDEQVRCATWIDPVTERVNVTVARTTKEGDVEVADDYDCGTRTLRYSVAMNDEAELWRTDPSPVTASLTRNEAIALLDALDRLELVDRGPRLSQHVPAVPRPGGGSPWTG